MPTVQQKDTFRDWLKDLRDDEARKRIVTRIARIEGGLVGDVKSIGDGVSEVKIDYGPGYRLYFTRQGQEIVILLCGGDKDSQSRDIESAKKLVTEK